MSIYVCVCTPTYVYRYVEARSLPWGLVIPQELSSLLFLFKVDFVIFMYMCVSLCTCADAYRGHGHQIPRS